MYNFLSHIFFNTHLQHIICFTLFLILRKLNDDRKSLDQKIALEKVTREELLKQIKVEYKILNTCQLKIDVNTNILQLILFNL